jgi:SAM-dependent methyltransferase
MTAHSNSVFDRLAPGYDASFTDRLPARWLRQRVRERVCQHLPEHARILDVGCGTGEDAIWFAERGHDVAATDVSHRMLEVTRAKCAALPDELRARLTVASYDAAATSDALPEGEFDLVFSNFGALNCVQDIGPFFEHVGGCIRPSGTVALTIMGRFCLWETIGFALRGEFARARRRWSGHSIFDLRGDAQPVWYHTLSSIRTMAGERFEIVDTLGVGVLVPSTEFFPICEQRPRLFRSLAAVESKIAGMWPFSRIGDHYLLLLRRQHA